MSHHKAILRRSSPWAAADKAISALSAGLGVCSAVCVVVMMCLIAADVFNRVTAGASIPGVYEVVESLVVFVAFLGLAYAERNNQNVRIELLTNTVAPSAARIMRIAGNLVAVIIVILFAIASWETAFQSLIGNETRQGLINFPLWPTRVVIAFGFTAVALELCCTLIRKVVQKPTGQNSEVPS